LAFAGIPEIVLAMVFLRAITDSFFTPAKQAAIQAMAEKSELMKTNSLSQVINQTSKLLGPAVGGALLLFVSSQMVFIINGAVSLFAMLLLFGLPKNIRPLPEEKEDEATGEPQKKNMLKEIAQGYKTVGRKPALWFTILLGAVGFFAVFLHDTLIGPVTKLLGFDQSILGLSIAAVGAGGVVGALGLGAIKKQIHPYFYVGPGLAISSCFTLFLGYAALNALVFPPWVFVGAFFTVGIFASAIFVPMRTMIQLETPPEQMGRVTAVNEAASVLAMMSAPFIGAVIARTYGLGMPFLIGGALSLVVGLITIMAIPLVKVTLEEQPQTKEPDLSKAV
jgi:predicted MFS family arabinose efflux permease